MVSFTGSGSAGYGAELIAFSLQNGGIKDYYVEMGCIIDQMMEAMSVNYHSESNRVELYTKDSSCSAELSVPIGINQDKAGIPYSFDCSTYFTVCMENHIPYVVSVPVVRSEDLIAVYQLEPSVTVSAEITYSSISDVYVLNKASLKLDC